MTRMSEITVWSTLLTVCLALLTTTAADEAAPPADALAPPEEASAEKTADESPEYLLRYHVTADEILRYRSVKVGELNYTVGETTKSDVERVRQVRRFEVKSVDDNGCADLVMQFESVEMSLQVNGGTPMVYRSSMDSAEVPQYFAGLDARLRGSAPRFHVTPVGAPLDENRHIIIPEQDNRKQGDKEKDKKNDNLPETRLMLPLPEKPVRVGDSWKYFSKVKVRVSEDFKREVPMLTSCRLESVEDGIARIRYSTSPAVRLTSVAAKAQLVSAMPKGYCLLDLEAGRIIKRVSRNNSNVHGVHGQQSVLTYSAEVVEELLPRKTQLSQR